MGVQAIRVGDTMAIALGVVALVEGVRVPGDAVASERAAAGGAAAAAVGKCTDGGGGIILGAMVAVAVLVLAMASSAVVSPLEMYCVTRANSAGPILSLRSRSAEAKAASKLDRDREAEHRRTGTQGPHAKDASQ